jgi:hypothetical protein
MLFSLMKSNNTKSIKKDLGFLDTDEEKERKEKRLNNRYSHMIYNNGKGVGLGTISNSRSADRKTYKI